MSKTITAKMVARRVPTRTRVETEEPSDLDLQEIIPSAEYSVDPIAVIPSSANYDPTVSTDGSGPITDRPAETIGPYDTVGGVPVNTPVNLPSDPSGAVRYDAAGDLIVEVSSVPGAEGALSGWLPKAILFGIGAYILYDSWGRK